MSAMANSVSENSGFFTRSLAEADPEVAASIADELGRQQGKIELIGGTHFPTIGELPYLLTLADTASIGCASRATRLRPGRPSRPRSPG